MGTDPLGLREDCGTLLDDASAEACQQVSRQQAEYAAAAVERSATFAAGYGAGAGQVALAPFHLAVNAFGSAIYDITGSDVDRPHKEAMLALGRSLNAALDDPFAFLSSGFNSSARRFLSASAAGDYYEAGKALGTLTTLVGTVLEGTSGINAGEAPAMATVEGTVVPATGIGARVGPEGPAAGAILMAKSADQSSSDTTSNEWSQATHGHHTYPKALGGHPDQELADILAGTHLGAGGVHSDLAKFEGGWLYPRKGMTGSQIVQRYGSPVVEEGLRRFYSQDKWEHLKPAFEEAVKFTHEQAAKGGSAP